MRSPPRERKRILAVSSGGGHWAELLRLRPAFEGSDLVYVSVRADYADEVPGHRFRVVNDATRWDKWALVLMAARLLWIVVQERPDVVVTTGAAPGYFALRWSWWFGARTVWVDSIANAGELSFSGRLAGRYADLWLTQWPHLAENAGPSFAGAVL